MSARIQVSAVLITRDAEAHLGAVLDPLRICDDIVVLDSGSRDGTEGIARAAGARFVTHPFDGYGPQKRRAVALAAHDWVLSVDADEVLDGEAAAALAAIDWARQDAVTCWRIRRRPFIGRREVRHGHWVPDLVVRLFDRRHHGFSDRLVHETVRPTGKVLTLPGSMRHYCYPDLAALFRADYQRLKAAEYRRCGRTAGGPVLAARAAAAFIRSYLLRGGFLDGPTGVVVALAGAVNAVTGLAMATAEPGSDRLIAGPGVDERAKLP